MGARSSRDGTETVAPRSTQACIGDGVDCHVKLTNYRKDGSTFANLLSMRPIHDSCGVLRFMISVQVRSSSQQVDE